MADWVSRFSVQGKRAFVTGATKEIGFVSAKLAAAGADIIAVGRDQKGLDDVCEQVEALGQKAVSLTGELSNADDCVRIAEQALEVFGTIDIPVNHAAYAASKAALNMLTQVMTAEWAPYNIQSNAVCPTVVMTEMGRNVWSLKEMKDPMIAKIPLGRFGETQEIADLTLFLASSASDLISGQIICADGGYTAL